MKVMALKNGMHAVEDGHFSPPVTYYVTGIRSYRAGIIGRDPANASRPSCDCPKGFDRDFCAHRLAALKHENDLARMS